MQVRTTGTYEHPNSTTGQASEFGEKMSTVLPLFANGAVLGWCRRPWPNLREKSKSCWRVIVVPDAASINALVEPGKPPTSPGAFEAKTRVNTEDLGMSTSGNGEV